MEERTFQKTIDAWMAKVPNAVKIGITSTFVMGILCNLFIFTNKAINHDDLMAEFIYNNSLDITSGRYMWLIIRRITSYYDMPMFFGLLGMAALAISVGMIIWLLGIKDNIFAILLAGIVGTYPINACYYSYLSISVIYYVAIFFAILGMFLVDRFGEKIWQRALGIVLGAVCIQVSLGTYQSFLALAVAIVFSMSFIDLFKRDYEIKSWFFKYFRYGVTAILGYLFYFVVTKIVLFVSEEQLRAYAGTDKMFSLSIREALKSVRDSYVSQYDYFFTNEIFTQNGYVMVNTCILSIILLFSIKEIMARIIKKKYLDAIIIGLMLVTAPFFLNIIYFMMNGKSSAHILMKYAQVVPYMLAIALVDASDFSCKIKKINFKVISQWIVGLCIIASIYIMALTCNQLYQRMYYNTKAIDTLCTNIVASLSNYEDFDINEPVYFANFTTFFNSNYVTTTNTFSEDLRPYVWMGTDIYEGWYSANHIMRYMDFNLHLHIIASNNASKEKSVRETNEFKEMPVFPNGGSVKRIDGLLTIKMGN